MHKCMGAQMHECMDSWLDTRDEVGPGGQETLQIIFLLVINIKRGFLFSFLLRDSKATWKLQK